MPCVRTILIVDGDSAMRETLREQLTLDDAFRGGRGRQRAGGGSLPVRRRMRGSTR